MLVFFFHQVKSFTWQLPLIFWSGGLLFYSKITIIGRKEKRKIGCATCLYLLGQGVKTASEFGWLLNYCAVRNSSISTSSPAPRAADNLPPMHIERRDTTPRCIEATMGSRTSVNQKCKNMNVVL